MQMVIVVAIGIVTLILLALLAVSLYRLVMVRAGGTPVILRRVPADPGIGWRHGLLRYKENSVLFYKLSSLKLGPDERIPRLGVAMGERRSPTGSEFDIMTDQILIITVGTPEQAYEVAFDSDGATAFLAWVESRPSERLQRGPSSRAS